MRRSELLSQIPMFSMLEKDDLESLASVTVEREYEKGRVVFFEEDSGDALFVILDGSVKVTISSEEGREIILTVLAKHDFFGEMSLLDNQPRSATVIAVDHAELLVLRRRDFLMIVKKKPHVLIALLGIITARLRKANRQIGNLALHDVYGRVARVFLEMASQYGERQEDGRVAFKRPTHQDIAGMIGATRETVSRMIKDLDKRGYIEVSGKKVIIRDGFSREFSHTG